MRRIVVQSLRACRSTTDFQQTSDLLKYLDQQTRTVQSRSLGLDELFDLPQTGIDYLIPGMLPLGETVLLVADPKTGKFLLAYGAAFSVATGEDTFLGEVCKSGKVLIIQTDESVGTAKGRLLMCGFHREDAANVRFMDSFNISQLAELEKQLEALRPSLVIIDSLRRINAGREISENSAEFSDNVYRLKEMKVQEINERVEIGKGIYSVLNRLLGKRLIGSRPSTIDRRRTVYFYPKDFDGEGDSPPPPPCDPIVIEYPETHSAYDVERSITNRSQESSFEPTKTVSDVEPVIVVEVEHKLVTQRGEGCNTPWRNPPLQEAIFEIRFPAV